LKNCFREIISGLFLVFLFLGIGTVLFIITIYGCFSKKRSSFKITRTH